MVRQDKFKVGDRVTWFDESYATLTAARERLGDGPFAVLSVRDVPYESYADYPEVGSPSNHAAMGHTQSIMIDGGRFSGAFFRRVDTETTS